MRSRPFGPRRYHIFLYGLCQLPIFWKNGTDLIRHKQVMHFSFPSALSYRRMEVDANVKTFSLKRCGTTALKISWWGKVTQFADARTLEPWYTAWYNGLVAANDPLVHPHLAPGVSEPQEPGQYVAVVVPPVASGSGNRPRRASVAPPVCELDSDDDEFMEDIPESLAEESPLNTPVAGDEVYNSELEGYNTYTVSEQEVQRYKKGAKGYQISEDLS